MHLETFSDCIGRITSQFSQGSHLVFQTMVFQLIFAAINMFFFQRKVVFFMENMFRVTKISWKSIVWKTRRDPLMQLEQALLPLYLLDMA